jgi:hypothetical protein
MGNIVIKQAIQMLARLILGSGAFERIIAVVERWADKEISGAEKRDGVLDEIQVIGLKLSKSVANLGVELAVQLLKRQA